MKRFCLCGFLVAVCLTLFAGEIQSQDTSDSIYLYPPGQFREGYLVEGLASVDWQIKQQRALQQTFSKSRNSIASNLRHYDAEIESLKKQLPKSFRFLNADGRSEMANRTMVQLLDAKLELAAMEASAGQLEKNIKDDGGKNASYEFEMMKLESELEMATMRTKLAYSEYKKQMRMHAKNSISQDALNRSKYAAELTQMEVKQAEAALQLKRDEAKVHGAEKLTDFRVEMEPIRARIKTIEEFQKELFDASDIFEKINRKQQERELLHKDLEMVSEALFESSKKMIELQSFRSLVEDEKKKLKRDPPKSGDAKDEDGPEDR